MAAVMTTRGRVEPRASRVDPTIRPRPPALRRYLLAPASSRRRVGGGDLLVAAKAGAALGGSPLAVPERRPAVSVGSPSGVATQYVVQPGDSLWSIAEELEPGDDPRPVVDALADARGDAPLVPGETIVWSG